MNAIPPFFSIVVPIYNVSKYLEECLNSILKQNMSDFEVILVNDGSTDNSKEICEKYVDADSRFFLIDQKNSGLFKARCNGIRKARGKYILHIDSDDTWPLGVLEYIKRIIDEQNADLVVFNCNLVDENNELIEIRDAVFDDRTTFETESEKEEFIKKMLETTNLNNVVLKCAHRDIVSLDIDNEVNERIMMGEDVVHSMPLIASAKKIFYTCEPLYNYRIHLRGMSRSIKVEYLFDFAKVRYCFFSYIQHIVSNSTRTLFFSRYIHSACNYLAKISMLVENKNQYKEIYGRLQQTKIHNEYESNKKQVPLKEKLLFILVHPVNFYFLKLLSKLYFRRR